MNQYNIFFIVIITWIALLGDNSANELGEVIFLYFNKSKKPSQV